MKLIFVPTLILFKLEVAVLEVLRPTRCGTGGPKLFPAWRLPKPCWE